MAEEFSNFLDQTREAPLREKVDGLSEIIEKMMMLIMSIPDNVDKLFSNINDKITGIDKKINGLEGKIANLKVSQGIVANPSAPISTSGGAPGAPPPPPGAPPMPGAPPRPGAPPTPPRPANPVSLRSSIMGELKELFKKRRAWENE